MKRCAISSFSPFLKLTSHPEGSTSSCLQFSFFRRCLSQRLSASGSPNTRPFPDYSPKKPTIRDAEFVHQISTAVKLHRFEPLRRILKPYESKFRPDHVIWVLMNIRSDYKLVLDFFDWACLRKDPNLEVRCIVIQLAVASKDLKTAHWLIHEFWAKPNLDVSLSFTHFVERLIYTYKDWGSNPHVFDVFFQVLVEVRLLNEARKLFDKMLNYGLAISIGSCNLYLARLSDSYDGLGVAIRIFSEFPEVGVCWNTSSYNIIIHCLCRLGKIKEAHILLLKMELKGCLPDVISYSTVINGYCHLGELQRVLKLTEEMQIKGLKPNKYTYNSIIFLLCKSGKLVEAETVLREMMNQGIVPDNVIYTTLIDGFCKLGNVAAACKVFDEMQGLKIIPDLLAYTAIICGFCQIGKMMEADKLFHELLERGLEPDEVTYTALIDGYCKAGEIKKAFSIHNHMVQVGLTPNIVTYTALVDGLCKQGEVDTANELLQEMCRKGLQLNICTYNAIVNVRGHSKARNMKEAWFLHREMVDKGFNLSTTAYSALIKGFLKRKKFLEARELFEEMRRRGLVADREIYNSFVDINFEEGHMETTLELCDEAIEWFLVNMPSLYDPMTFSGSWNQGDQQACDTAVRIQHGLQDKRC
ncbi:hypothetical protein Patl1_16297 [Pistacia atlantica]|uniref:Uncharacterized protein n=1 Tax=Pistacia atlantica TaxID=434234 RepID=A0ACC1B895_9ROSI|nr:hypothetical protein Patl1_16297 [Pistacia atlantica]